jgi:Phage Mu protein F like protein
MRLAMTKAIDALIARERKRQPKRMARLERPLAGRLSVVLDGQARVVGLAVLGKGPWGSLFKVYQLRLEQSIYVASIGVWKEFADPESIDTKKLPDIPDTIARRLRREALATAKLIGKTTKRRVEKIITDGKEKSLSLSDIAKAIRQKLGGSAAKRRASGIANDQVAYAANDAANHAAREAGMKFKIWTTSQKENVRPCHQAVHGQKVKIGGLFTVCGDKFRFPKDRTYSPALNNVIRCQCHCTYTRR